MIIENVNDILSIAALFLILIIPAYFVIIKAAALWRGFNERRIQRLMKEDDWHM